MRWFRLARHATISWNLLKTAFQIVAIWGLFLFLLPPAVAALGDALGIPRYTSTVTQALAAVMFAAASALGLTTAYVMVRDGGGTPLPLDAARRLVITGPYARVRNPMALSGLTQGLGVAIWHGSPLVLLYVIAGGLLWQFGARPAEEEFLARLFAEPYEAYRRAVPLWIPRWSRYVAPSEPPSHTTEPGSRM